MTLTVIFLQNIVVGGDVVDVNTIGTYVITYNVADAFGNQAIEVTRTVNILSSAIDVTPPVIVLNGSSNVNITVGGTYTEEGATASDDKDGDISANIVIGGDVVNTSAAGTYKVTYTVADAAGNSTTVERTVTVGAAPAVELLVNGDFETTMADPWIGNGGAVNIMTEGGNSFYFADLATPGSTQFEVNLQQVDLTLTQDQSYVLTFTGSTSAEDNPREIIVGIGLNEQPFTSVEQVVELTDEVDKAFTVNLTATGFGGSNCRVFFDIANQAGVVVLDNISLKEAN